MAKRRVRVRSSPKLPDKDTDTVVSDLMREMRDLNNRIGALEQQDIEAKMELNSMAKHLEYSLVVLESVRLAFDYSSMESNRPQQIDALFRNIALALTNTDGTLNDYRSALWNRLAASGSVPHNTNFVSAPSDPDIGEDRSAIDDVMDLDEGMD